MLVFGSFEGQRMTLEVPTGMTVHSLKEMIQDKLGISVDLYRQDKKVLVISYAGSDMGDDWVFSDLGIGTLLGSDNVTDSEIFGDITIILADSIPATGGLPDGRGGLREEVKPVLYIRCSHSQETISVYDDITIAHLHLDKIRSMASMKSGLPVGIFRLTTEDGREMFDQHRLEDYGVDVGHTILLENWDGWNEFLNLAIMGFTPQVVSQIGGEEIVARYQMKVALFIAAHFGHVDLARAMLRQGVKCDDPTGYHPARMWCKEDGHIDALKCPVHEATIRGQLGVLRLFVNVDITCLKARDGYDLEPLNIALRNKVKNCASFLLTKQWSKININKTFALHLATYTRLKKWCERAKERALLKYGQAKSTLRRRNFKTGPLVSHGILVDGFSQSPMTGKPKAVLQKEEKENREKEKRRPKFTVSVSEILGSTEEPETYFRSVAQSQNLGALGQGQGKVPIRWGKIQQLTRKSSQFDMAVDGKRTTGTSKSPHEDSTPEPGRPSLVSEVQEHADDSVPKLPPIMQRLRIRLMSQSQPSITSELPAKGLAAAAAGREKGDCTSRSKTDKDGLSGAKGTMVNRLIKSKNAYFVSTTPNKSQSAGLFLPMAGTANFQNPPPSERSDKPSLSVQSDHSVADGVLNTQRAGAWKTLTARSATSASSSNEDAAGEEEDKKNTARLVAGRKKRKPRVSSALLLSKAKSSEGSIPLPLISNEQDRRPFFYHQGQREDELVDSALELVAKYRGGHTSRERAIQSLTTANTFRDKPWLGQVRVALNLTSNSLKRNVRRLQVRKKKITN
ncbi:protein ankub1-like [Plakobranchus ocellatus]|uniref:Protein ankub1-like n=1 Tax=Plakobranchus ocellatus TaxID=259542 RepID=A0AAV4B4S6_9GAST|nr:protein ankub1-like [Plakobranchus ocellatus]